MRNTIAALQHSIRERGMLRTAEMNARIIRNMLIIGKTWPRGTKERAGFAEQIRINRNAWTFICQ